MAALSSTDFSLPPKTGEPWSEEEDRRLLAAFDAQEKEAREAMKLAAAKVPILTRFATRFAQEKVQ